MSAARREGGFNANSVLLLILMGISGWTLTTLLEVKDTLTKTVVRVDYLQSSDAAHARILADMQAARKP